MTTVDGARPAATRRRGDALEAAILTAAWEELREHGYAKTTMSGIAARAGTGKAVLYRRWRNLAELTVAAFRVRFTGSTPPEPTGDLRADVIAYLRRSVEIFQLVPADVVAGLLSDVSRDHELGRRLRRGLAAAPHADHFRRMLEDAAARGDVNPARLTARTVALPFDVLRQELLLFAPEDTGPLLAEFVDEIYLPLLRSR